jgi:hypothetical protein
MLKYDDELRKLGIRWMAEEPVKFVDKKAPSPASVSDIKIINPLRDTAIQRLVENASCIVSDNRQKGGVLSVQLKAPDDTIERELFDWVSPLWQRTASLLDQIMLKRLLSKLTGNRQQIEHHLKNQYQVEENGLSFPQSLVDDPDLWALASWLEQLAEEDYLISLTDRWLLSWDALYRLLEDEEHASSLPLIGVPEILPLRASLSSRGALSDSDFRVWIAEWATVPTSVDPFQPYRCYFYL